MSLLEQLGRKISCWSAGVLYDIYVLHFLKDARTGNLPQITGGHQWTTGGDILGLLI